MSSTRVLAGAPLGYPGSVPTSVSTESLNIINPSKLYYLVVIVDRFFNHCTRTYVRKALSDFMPSKRLPRRFSARRDLAMQTRSQPPTGAFRFGARCCAFFLCSVPSLPSSTPYVASSVWCTRPFCLGQSC